jgi:hypothetical protein
METTSYLRRQAAFCLRLSDFCSDEPSQITSDPRLPTTISEPCGPSSTSGMTGHRTMIWMHSAIRKRKCRRRHRLQRTDVRLETSAEAPIMLIGWARPRPMTARSPAQLD